MTLYKNKYRTQTSRLPNWDYSRHGYYYVTICTHNKISYFGEVVKESDKNISLHLLEIGHAANQCWQEIPRHFPFVRLDEYVIMPNHVHGILEIMDMNKKDEITETQYPPCSVETQNLASLRAGITSGKFGPQSQNLSSIIRGFKIGVTKWARINNHPFAWQPRFFDHIIRKENNLNRIRDYIRTNPANWDEDENNTR